MKFCLKDIIFRRQEHTPRTLKLTPGNRKGLPFSASGAIIILKEAV